MKNDIITDITNYIDFLRSHDLMVSLSIISDKLSMEYPVLYKYEIHTLIVCSYLKSSEHTFKMCVKNKNFLKKSVHKTPYYSCCYAGVEEFVVPVLSQNDIIAYINISGYRNTLDKSKTRYKCIKKHTSNDFEHYYSLLSDTPPDMNTMLSFARPLVYMLKALYDCCPDSAEHHESSYIIYQKILSYISKNYIYRIDSLSIGKHLNYSASYINYLFKKHSGESIMKYVSRLRLEKAKELLTRTNISIASVANYTGFSDSNYFSAYFKRIEKATPSEYRKANRKR